VLPGTKVLEAAAQIGLALETPCGGAGTCHKCRVRITSGAPDPSPADRDAFGKRELAEGWRLACQAAVTRPAAVRVPEESRFGDQHKILTEARTAAGDVVPAVRKVYVELAPPTLADDAPDLLRLERTVGAVKTDLDLLRELPGLLRAGDFKGTAVVTDHHLIDFEPGDTSSRCYGAAFDVGTTTLVGSLMDLRTGDDLALASEINPQVSFGDDVLSRIRHSGLSDEGAEQLRRAIVDAIGGMIDELCAEAGVAREHVYELSFAGNTTMEHLLCGIDVTQMGQVPFVPAHARGLVARAAELGVPIHKRGAAYVFPVIGGFVGGDTVAGMLATRLDEQPGPALLVDIGTNGEIVVRRDGTLLAASTAAGPAFEGARISCGMRATRGAIEKVVFDGDVRCGVIGDAPPIGMCGSALVDLAAELLGAGVVTPEGRLLPPDELPRNLPDALRRRVSRQDDGQTRFLVAEADRTQVTLTQRDVRELQLASGAIRAGIAILLKQAGLRPEDLCRVLIAGAFGSFIRRNHAQRIGLLPADIDHKRIHYVGNTSLSGAKWALVSTAARKQAEELARRTRHVELSRDGDFQTHFAEAMIFPA
jgi:uncharacterized 2Fe-2S/4Fe-4S cluster protein (DUF4445 family)